MSRTRMQDNFLNLHGFFRKRKLFSNIWVKKSPYFNRPGSALLLLRLAYRAHMGAALSYDNALNRG